jgi:hypothetical protein
MQASWCEGSEVVEILHCGLHCLEFTVRQSKVLLSVMRVPGRPSVTHGNLQKTQTVVLFQCVGSSKRILDQIPRPRG